ncbi:10923_t:CDS:2, partial [Entrophospora sp. SA101]
IIIQCGKIANSSCSPGYCCSIFGHCGQTPSHCGTDGCDPTYGVCGQVTTSNGLTSVMTTMTTTPLPTNSAQTIEASSTTPKTTSSDSSSTPTTNNSSGSFIKIHSGSLNGLFIIVMIATTLKQLKERLKKITGVPVNGQKIIFSGDEIATLGSFGLHHNSKILLIGTKPN